MQNGNSLGPGWPGKTSFRHGSIKETRKEETEGRMCPGEEMMGRWAQADLWTDHNIGWKLGKKRMSRHGSLET